VEPPSQKLDPVNDLVSRQHVVNQHDAPEDFSHGKRTLVTVRDSRVRRPGRVQPEEVRVMRNQDAPGLRCKVQLFEVVCSHAARFVRGVRDAL